MKISYKIRDRQEFKTMRKNSGFTMVELIVVIAIMAIITAIGVPNYLSYLPKMRLRSAGDELYSNLQFTKMEAIHNNVNWAVDFNGGTGYTIKSDTDSNGGGGTVEKTVSLASSGSGVSYGSGSATTAVLDDIATSLPSDGISYGAPSDNIAVFTPRGMITKLGYVYLTNANSSMAVGTPTLAGVVVQRVWSGSVWQ